MARHKQCLKESVMTDDEKTEQILSKLTADQEYYITCDWFGTTLMGKPVLVVPVNDHQRSAFESFLKMGLMYLDVERGKVGYRTTYYAQDVKYALWKKYEAEGKLND